MTGVPTLVLSTLKPNLVDEVSDTITYLGFAKRGDRTKCAIIKIEKTDTVTEFLCPNGQFSYDFDWNNRANEAAGAYTYQLQKI